MERKLHGNIRIFGKIPNDPLDDCEGKKLVGTGLGFIGRYKDGIPTGFCWRGITNVVSFECQLFDIMLRHIKFSFVVNKSTALLDFNIVIIISL